MYLLKFLVINIFIKFYKFFKLHNKFKINPLIQNQALDLDRDLNHIAKDQVQDHNLNQEAEAEIDL